MNISDRIKTYRKSLGLTQEELASRANINEKYFGRIERGESCPTIDYVIKICDAMDIDIIELFLFEEKSLRSFRRNPRITNVIIQGLRNDVDIHFNKDALYENCENAIWYNGYIGSMSFDEFEYQLYAEGNIKGKLYIDYCEILDINSNNASNEIRKYVQDDESLSSLIEYMPFDESILSDHNGSAFFIIETNWLLASVTNKRTHEILADGIVLDTDNIISGLSNYNLLFDIAFNRTSDDENITEMAERNKNYL